MARFINSGLGSSISLIVTAALWIVSMFVIFEKNYATSESADLTEIPMGKSSSNEFQTWMDVNFGGDKIGYTMQSLVNTPLGYVLKDYSLIKLPMGGTVREVYLDSYAVLNLDYSLKSFTFGLVSEDYTTDVFGESRNGKLIVKVRSQNSESILKFDAEEGIFFPAAVPLLARAKGFPEGEFTLPTFDPFSLVTDELKIIIGGQEEIETGFGKRKGYRLSMVFSGVMSYMWIDKNGRVLREEETGDLEMVATDMERALDIPFVEAGGKDLLLNLAVPCNGEISDPRNAEFLKVLIEGIEPELFDLDDDFQTIISTDPLILDIHPGRIDPSTLEKSERFLSSQTFLQVEDPRIKKASSEITFGLSNPSSIAFALGQWVYENITKDYTVSLPSAVDILDVKRGDCNEHTSLFTALARAAGLPTKICIGIVYKDGFFYYHAWPAVHLGGWQPMDPTFGQQTADATHIKLLEGGFERQADLIRAVGRLSVTVLESSKRDNL